MWGSLTEKQKQKFIKEMRRIDPDWKPPEDKIESLEELAEIMQEPTHWKWPPK
mgnify:FL=1